MERLLKPALIAIVVGFAALGINNIVTTNNQVQLREVQLKSANSELKQLQLDYDQLNLNLDKALHTKQENADEVKKLREQKQKLEKRQQELEQQLSAKREAAKLAAAKTQAAASFSGVAYAAGGNKDSWLAASGIPKGEWGYVDWIVSRESGWDPCAYYPGQSNCNARPVNACGLVQQNPCHKIPGDWRDPVAALKWQYQYVKDRYGGYAQAVSYWQANGHY